MDRGLLNKETSARARKKRHLLLDNKQAKNKQGLCRLKVPRWIACVEENMERRVAYAKKKKKGPVKRQIVMVPGLVDLLSNRASLVAWTIVQANQTLHSVLMDQKGAHVLRKGWTELVALIYARIPFARVCAG